MAQFWTSIDCFQEKKGNLGGREVGNIAINLTLSH